MGMNRLKLLAETEREFIKSCAIIDYDETRRILETVNNATLIGVSVNDIVKHVELMIEVKRIG